MPNVKSASAASAAFCAKSAANGSTDDMGLRRYVDEMFAVSGEAECARFRLAGLLALLFAAALTRVGVAIAARPDNVTFGVLRRFDLLLALADLGRKGRLSRLLRCLRRLLGSTSLGRVLRRGKISQL